MRMRIANKRNECVKLTLHFKQTYKIRELAAMTVWRWRGWRQGDRGSDEVVGLGEMRNQQQMNEPFHHHPHPNYCHHQHHCRRRCCHHAKPWTHESSTQLCWYARYAVQCPCVCVCAMLCRSVINLSVSQGGLLLQISHCSYTRIQWNGIKLQHAIAKGQAGEFIQHIHIYIK